uniref:TIL domain-containing protein n=1 Tax=Anopheles christyi TaxID=43041 RepID=A0A182KF63_9DIPT
MTSERWAIFVILAMVGLPTLLSAELQYVQLAEMLHAKCKIHGKQIFSPCFTNETYVCCGTVCEGTCDNVLPMCPMKVSCPWRCFCTEGLVRHEDRCISPSQCPPALASNV